MKQPYKYWSRNDLFWKLRRHMIENGVCDNESLQTLRVACWDERWNPMEEYNGCNFVQDDLHPFPPCFFHDWRWITRQNIKLADYYFREDLIKFGFPEWKANIYYYTVRIAYLCYYQFKHKR